MTVAPQNLEAEENVLGACLQSPRAIETAAEELRAEDFYLPKHGIIFRAAQDLHAMSEPVDPVSLAAFLAERGELNRVGGKVRLAELALSTFATANCAHHARLIRDTARRRALIEAGHRIAELGHSDEGTVRERLDQAQALAFALDHGQDDDGPELIAGAARDALHWAQHLAESGEAIIGTPSGLTDLDRVTLGFQPGNLVIVAARPGMGKTALALNIAAHLSIRRGLPTMIFSLEMSRRELAQRLICSESRVDMQKIRSGKMSGDEWAKVIDATAAVEAAPIIIDEDPTVSPMDVRSRLRRVKARHPDLALCIVDYLQLMVDGKAEHRVAETSGVSRKLKLTARATEVPVLALAQLSRNCEYRPDKRPILADLRDSGAIEQDADLTVFIYRDDYYNKNSDTPGIAELIVAKHRNGPQGLTVRTAWRSSVAAFKNLAYVAEAA